MNDNDVIEILKNELKCIDRANHCDRDCGNCDLVLEDTELIEAYERAIHSVKRDYKYKKSFRRFKRKYMFLKIAIKRALKEMEDKADSDAYSDYQVAVNHGIKIAFDILKKHTYKEV